MFSCREAAALIDSGDYEAAREALGQQWRGAGKEPDLNGLPAEAKGEVLLQVGVLSGFLARAHVSGSQEPAKDLLSKSMRYFHEANNVAKTAEVRSELALCYWRTGAFDEARILLEEAMNGLESADLTARILIRLTLVEISQSRYLEAWDLLKKAQPLFDHCSESTKGRWHGQLALVFRRLSTAQNRSDYADRAILEFTAAIFHYELAGHERHRARNLNNLAMLLYRLGRYGEAHQHLDRARQIFGRLSDRGAVAEVDDTRCRILLAEKRYQEAEKLIEGAIKTLQEVGQLALLTDALTMKATILSRLEDKDLSLAVFQEAIRIGEEAGATTSAGLAALSLIEEHSPDLGEAELCQAYSRADEMLAHTQDAEHLAELRNCARLVVEKLKLDPAQPLVDVMHAHEARYIETALLEEGGSVTRAARRLGVTHQGLASILNSRHKGLLAKRTPIINRRRSIFKIKQERKKGRRFFSTVD